MYNELVFTELIANRILIYLNNMRKPRACTDEFTLIRNINAFINFSSTLHIVTFLERELYFQRLSYVVNIKGFFSISHYETL